MKDNKQYLMGGMWSALLLLVIYLFLSGGFDRLIYNKLGAWVIALLVLIGMPVLAYKAISVFFKTDTAKGGVMLAVMASVIFLGFGFAFVMKKREAKVYRKYGVRTKGIVISAFDNKGAHMYYRFTADSEEYESFNVSNPLHHRVLDSVDIIYNSKNPEMNEAIENL